MLLKLLMLFHCLGRRASLLSTFVTGGVLFMLLMLISLSWEVRYFAIHAINAILHFSREVCYFAIYDIFNLS